MAFATRRKRLPDHVDVRRANVAKFCRAFGIDDFSYRRAKTGTENVSLFVTTGEGKERVLRIWRKGPGSKTPPDIVREAGAMAFFAENDVPVPRVFPAASGELFASVPIGPNTWHALLMECKTGIHPPIYSLPLLGDFARTQAHLHLLGQTLYKQNRDDLPVLGVSAPLGVEIADEVNLTAIGDTNVRDFVERAKTYAVTFAPDLPRALCHMDFDAGNVLADGDPIAAVLDFDNLAAAPMAACLGNTLWHVAARTGEQGGVAQAAVDFYFSEYERARDWLVPGERAAVYAMMALRNYVVGCYMLFLGGAYLGGVAPCLAREAELSDLSVGAVA